MLDEFMPEWNDTPEPIVLVKTFKMLPAYDYTAKRWVIFNCYADIHGFAYHRDTAFSEVLKGDAVID